MGKIILNKLTPMLSFINASTNSLFTLQIALGEIDSDQFLSTVYATTAKPAPINKKLKPTIIILIEGKLVYGIKGFVCSTIVRLVSMIKFYGLAKISQFREVG